MPRVIVAISSNGYDVNFEDYEKRHQAAYAEFAAVVVVLDIAHRRAKADPVAQARLFDTALDVVPEHGARRIGGDWPAKMLLEGIVGEFQALLGAVRPQIAVHAAMDRLAVLVSAGAPGVVP